MCELESELEPARQRYLVALWLRQVLTLSLTDNAQNVQASFASARVAIGGTRARDAVDPNVRFW